ELGEVVVVERVVGVLGKERESLAGGVAHEVTHRVVVLVPGEAMRPGGAHLQRRGRGRPAAGSTPADDLPLAPQDQGESKDHPAAPHAQTHASGLHFNSRTTDSRCGFAWSARRRNDPSGDSSPQSRGATPRSASMAVRASAFAVQHRVMVSLEPDTAWLRLTHVQDGWDSQLIGSGASKDLSL